MNKSMLMGLVGGVAIATAGGVAGYALLSSPANMNATAAVVDIVAEPPSAAVEPMHIQPTPAAATNRAPAAAAQAPRAAAVPVPQPVAAAMPQSVAQPAPTGEECWDEQVTVQADPKDDKAIAGTAAGALVGGALAKRLGDDNDLVTAAGAAAGAFAGRKLQRRVQENNATTVTERRCQPL